MVIFEILNQCPILLDVDVFVYWIIHIIMIQTAMLYCIHIGV